MAAYREYYEKIRHEYDLLNRVGRIWTHNIRGIEFHRDFQSESCPAGNSSSTGQMAATIAAGETGEDVYKALDEHSVVVVGGASPVRTSLRPSPDLLHV